MLRLIAFVLLVFPLIVQAQQTPTLVSIGSAWEIVESTRIGSTSRIVAQSQNPYPFCFSYAAAALFDQTRCIADKLSDCQLQPRSSSLAITPAGQRLPMTDIKVDSGGVTRLSLNDIVHNGYVPQALCNTDFGMESDLDLNQRMTSGRGSIFLTYEKWHTYKDWTPYLTRFYRHYFLQHATGINPLLSTEDAESLLVGDQILSKEQLFGKILLRESCHRRIRDDRFKIKSVFVGEAENFDPALTYASIQKNLEQNRPVSVDFCMFGTAKNYGRCVSDARHAAIIVAQAQARHKATGDLRTVYWLVNTWSEKWQKANNDGWVFADKLLNGIYGKILWLELK
jgi:hypothetical protein